VKLGTNSVEILLGVIGLNREEVAFTQIDLFESLTARYYAKKAVERVVIKQILDPCNFVIHQELS